MNDANYATKPGRNSMWTICPYYKVWRNMLMRCYSKAWQSQYPTYIGCTVAPEWHSFMAFRAWMVQQDWPGKHLDKDIIVPGNKVYGPDACVFVSPQVNTLFSDRAAARGEWPQGVTMQNGKYVAAIGINNHREHLGRYTTSSEASTTYRDAKAKRIRQVAGEQTDDRIRNGLLRHAEIYQQGEAA